ncbi:ROK family protein [Streptomyces sp. NPDC090108]|uniref:ROK family protein n=1 Tax=Streptomyces sp. NPDC090108 TaxID=3365947 RepID=UPI0037F20A6A
MASGAGAGALAGAGAGAEAEVGVEGPAWSGAGVDAEAGRRGVSSLAGDGEVSGAAGESARGRAEDVVAAVAREIAGLVAEVLGDDGDDGDDGGDGDGRGDGGGAGEEGGADGSGYAPGTGDAGHGGAGGVGGGGVHGLAGVGTLLGVGVALPGPLDHVGGVLHRVTGFPEWEGFPLRDALAERLGVPVVVDKDTNAAALGLSVGGEGGSFAYLHLGTGLGAGLVIGGSVHRGTRTGAGEFGHQVLQLDGVPCGCGDRGCMEALCLAAVERGDVAEAARVLGVGAGNLAGLLDIDLVLLGGRTVAGAPEAYVSGVAGVLAARARREGAPGGTVPVRVAPGGERGVAEGAAQLLLAPMFGRADG